MREALHHLPRDEGDLENGDDTSAKDSGGIKKLWHDECYSFPPAFQ